MDVNLLFCLSFYKVARLVLTIPLHQMVCTTKPVFVDRADSIELVILGMTDADFVRSNLMIRSEVCTSTRKV